MPDKSQIVSEIVYSRPAGSRADLAIELSLRPPGADRLEHVELALLVTPGLAEDDAAPAVPRGSALPAMPARKSRTHGVGQASHKSVNVTYDRRIVPEIVYPRANGRSQPGL